MYNKDSKPHADFSAPHKNVLNIFKEKKEQNNGTNYQKFIGDRCL